MYKKTGVIPIDEKKRIDWSAIRAEYIGGGISQRKLAEKHGVPWRTLQDRARREGWREAKAKACEKAVSLSCQKTAESIADHAVIAADIKKRLLLRLKRIEEKYPLDATEVRSKAGNSIAIYRIKDLTAAYRDLTDDLQTTTADKNAPIHELLRKLDGECDV